MSASSPSPESISISDFSGFSNGVLAEFCRKWPGTPEARAAKAELVSRKVLPYDEWCSRPWECVAAGGRCKKDPNCGD